MKNACEECTAYQLLASPPNKRDFDFPRDEIHSRENLKIRDHCPLDFWFDLTFLGLGMGLETRLRGCCRGQGIQLQLAKLA